MGCGGEDEADGDEWAAGGGCDARDVLRGEKVGGVAVVAVVGVVVAVGDDEATVVVVAVVAGVAYAWRVPLKESSEVGRLRS